MDLHIDRFRDDRGNYIDDDGVVYGWDSNNGRSDFMQHVLGDVCCCGNPDEFQKYVRDILRSIKDRHDSKESFDETFRKFSEWEEKFFVSTGAEMMAYYFLDKIKLIEHGSSVCSAWLTEKGKEVLEDLERMYPEL